MQQCTMRSSAPCHTRFCSRPTPSVVHARSRALVGRPCRHIAAAVVSEDGTIPLPFLPLSIPEKLYTVIQAGVLTFSLGVADAGYSGDWSRIGAISKDNELLLQTVFLWIVVSHSVVGAMAAYTASTKGRNPPLAFVKGLAFGLLSLNIEWLAEEEKSP